MIGPVLLFAVEHPPQPDSAVWWWVLSGSLGLAMTGLFFFFREMKKSADLDRKAILEEVRNNIPNKIDDTTRDLEKKIGALKDQVAHQNGSIGAIEREVKIRVEHAQERHDQNMREHKELFAQMREFGQLLGARRKRDAEEET